MFLMRIIWMALRGLQANLLRSLLATLGVIIGVSAVVSAMAILEGATKEISERFESMGADQAFVASGGGRRQSRHIQIPTLTPEDAEALRTEDDSGLIRAVVPEFQFPDTIQYFERNKSVQLSATTEEYASVNNYRPVQGRFLTTEDVRAERKVCVLGHKVAKDLFGDQPAVDKRLKIRGVGFQVIGVMEKKGFLGFRNVDDQVIVPLNTGMKRLFFSRFVTTIAVQSRSADELGECIFKVEEILRRSHRIRPGNPDDFEVYTVEEAKKQFGFITSLFGIVLNSIAGISLVVGGIGIMNIMLVSVTERTREIGVRMAVGARRFDILKQFLIEANVISLLGGGLGVLLGLVFTGLLSSSTGELVKPLIEPATVYWALAMAVLVGVVSGLYPAYRASRLDPVDALRYE